ncbi:MAG: class I SAM-dependent methyltransferase [Anaerolineae bacterium]
MMDDPLSGYEKSAQFYDLFDDKENVGFFCYYATQAGELLDVGAGTGRIAILLAERGARIVCVEPSRAMRREFQGKLRRRPDVRGRITLVPGDAASFTLHRRFPVAFLSGTFDHLLDRETRLASLRNIARHLEPDGTVVFDVFLASMHDTPLSPAGRVERGGVEYRRFVARRVLPGQKMMVKLVFEVYRQGELQERIAERSMVGHTDRAEVRDVLAEVGFFVRREFSDYDFTPYQEGADLLIVEAVYRPESV